jgi:hypothetical protein
MLPAVQESGVTKCKAWFVSGHTFRRTVKIAILERLQPLYPKYSAAAKAGVIRFG